QDLHSFPTRRSSDLKGKIYFKRYFENELITSLCSDKEGNMWIGTWGNGLYMFNEKSGQIKKFAVNKSQSNFIPGNYIQDVYEDRSEEHTSELQSREN